MAATNSIDNTCHVYAHAGSTIDSVGGLFSTVDIIEGSAFLNQVTLSNVWHDTFYPETEEAGLSPAPAPAAGDYDAAAPGPGGFDYYDYARQRYVEAVPMEVRGESASIVALVRPLASTLEPASARGCGTQAASKHISH